MCFLSLFEDANIKQLSCPIHELYDSHAIIRLLSHEGTVPFPLKIELVHGTIFGILPKGSPAVDVAVKFVRQENEPIHVIQPRRESAI